MYIDNKFKIGQIVYLRMDVEQLARIVTGITVRVNGHLIYGLTSGVVETWHNDIEISAERDILLVTTN